MTINDLIKKVTAGELTVTQAVDVVEREGKGLAYGIEYFRPSSKAELPYWDLRKEWMARQDAKKADPEPTTQQKTGQLWEPCKCCGLEPCYMPLQLCDDCWPIR